MLVGCLSPVLGPLLVVAHVTHVPEDLVGGAQDVVDYFPRVGFEVARRQFLCKRAQGRAYKLQ